jgi:hypothetical protein
MAEPIDSERSCALTSTMGDKATGKGSFGRLLPFNRWRRERGGGILVLPVGDSPPTAHAEWLDLGACWVPRAGVANRWTLVGVFKSGVSLVCTRAALFMGLAR